MDDVSLYSKSRCCNYSRSIIITFILLVIFSCMLASTGNAEDWFEKSTSFMSHVTLVAETENDYTQEVDSSLDNPKNNENERFLKATAGYDVWYTIWSVYNPTPDYIEYDNYEINPTLTKGFFTSISSGTQSSNKWGLSVSAYGDYISKNEGTETKEGAKYINGILNYGFNDKQILTQFQKAEFKGELVGQYAFKTDWTKIEISFMPIAKSDNIGQLGGFGIRYLQYSMPMEFTYIKEISKDNYKDVGHEVIYVDTKGITVGVKSLDPMILGYNNGRLFFYDIDWSLGISRAYAKEFVDNVYGLEINFDVDAGLKHAFKIYNGFIGVKAGYRLFSDIQLLNEGENTDKTNTTATIINNFHGPFVSVMGSF